MSTFLCVLLFNASLHVFFCACQNHYRNELICDAAQASTSIVAFLSVGLCFIPMPRQKPPVWAVVRHSMTGEEDCFDGVPRISNLKSKAFVATSGSLSFDQSSIVLFQFVCFL